MDVQVVIEGDIGVQGGVDAARGQELDGLLQRVDALHSGTVAFGQFHIGGGEAVGGGLALQVLEGLDVVVVLLDGEGGVDVAVGGGEVVGQGALVGDLDAVADHIIAARIQTGEQAVPVAFHILRLHAQLLGDGAGDLDVIADEGVALIVIAPRLPCTFQRNDQFAVGLNSGELVRRSGVGRSSAGSGGAGGTAVGGAAGEREHTGGCHDAHQGNKGSSFHTIPLNLYVQFYVKTLLYVLPSDPQRIRGREPVRPLRRFP